MCKSFSSIVLVSLVMEAKTIFASCSSMDAIPIVITKNNNGYFDTSISELILKLTSTIKSIELLVEPFNIEG